MCVNNIGRVTAGLKFCLQGHVPLQEGPRQQARCVPNTVISLPQHTYYMQSLLGLLATFDTDVKPGRFLRLRARWQIMWLFSVRVSL